jgi:uncharacterized membrane protein
LATGYPPVNICEHSAVENPSFQQKLLKQRLSRVFHIYLSMFLVVSTYPKNMSFGSTPSINQVSFG